MDEVFDERFGYVDVVTLLVNAADEHVSCERGWTWETPVPGETVNETLIVDECDDTGTQWNVVNVSTDVTAEVVQGIVEVGDIAILSRFHLEYAHT